MAAIYTRVYTYTGHAYWDNDAMSVPLSSFEVSGATDKNIGQIVSIQYEHTHSSGASATWTLAGRLVIGSKNYDSDPVQKAIGRNNIVTFVNAFSTLPTAEEFLSGATVQTIVSATTTANSNLTWYAGEKYPLRIIVTFYDQPPTKYAPQIVNFAVERVTSGGVASPEGTYIATTLKLAFASGAPTEEATVKLYTSTTEGATGTETDLLSKVTIAQLISGVSLNTSLISGQYSAGTTFFFTVVVTIGSETAAASAQAFRAKAPIHITNYGVSFGGFSSATEDDPKEEFHNPVVFHKGFSMGDGIDGLAAIGIQRGLAEGITLAASTVTEYAVTFPQAFSAVPNVVATFDSTGQDMSTSYRWDYLTMTVCDVTATGFTLRVKNGTSYAFTLGLQWIAVGIP